MQYREYPAPPDLAEFVRAFWTLSAPNSSPSLERVLPDGRQEIVVHLGDPFLQIDSTGTVVRQPGSLFTGQSDGPLFLKPTGTTDIFGVCFHPGGAWPFLRWPQDECTGRILPLDDAWGPAFAQQIRSCENHVDRCGRAAALLRARLNPDDSGPRMRAAVALLQQEPWQRISTIAAAACLSPRHLERAFLQRVGLPPKTFAAILRFQHALRLRETQPALTWTQISQDCGYFDQAHLITDFRRFSGQPPVRHETEWTGMERAFVRD